VRWIGAVVVVTAALAPVSVEAQPAACSRCGPAPMYPSWECADGRHEGGRGPCVERQDGSCGWMRLVCPEDRAPSGAPATCSPAECGSPPAASSWACPGSRATGGFTACKRDREGRCGWIYRTCPAEAGPTSGKPPTAPRPPRPISTRPPPGPRPPPPAPAPAPMRSCRNLPRVDELRTWPVVGVCQPGGGPVQAPRERIRSLGDGTYIFADRSGCFRGRYMRCLSK